MKLLYKEDIVKKRNKIILVLSSLMIFSLMFIFAQKLQDNLRSKSLQSNKQITEEATKDKKENLSESEDKGENPYREEKQNSQSEGVADSETTNSKENKESQNKASVDKGTSKSDNNKSSDTKNTSSAVTDKSIKESKGTTESKQEKSSSTQEKPREQKIPNFIVRDMINNKVILSRHVDYENITVADLTKRILDHSGVEYRSTGAGATTYFTSIAGLTEKKHGPLSGWCYYVKRSGNNAFEKPPIGAGSLKYKKGDIVEWKYWSDGINEK